MNRNRLLDFDDLEWIDPCEPLQAEYPRHRFSITPHTGQPAGQAVVLLPVSAFFHLLGTVSSLSERVGALERAGVQSSLQQPSPHEQIGSFDPKIADILAVTAEVFADSEARFELDRDPEDPDNPFVVVTVRCQGDPQTITGRRLEWHQRIAKLSPGKSGAIRLSVIPA